MFVYICATHDNAKQALDTLELFACVWQWQSNNSNSFSPPTQKTCTYFVHHPFHFILFFTRNSLCVFFSFIRCLSFSLTLSCSFFILNNAVRYKHHHHHRRQERHSFHHSQNEQSVGWKCHWPIFKVWAWVWDKFDHFRPNFFFHSTKVGYGLNANDVHSVYDQFGCFLFGFHLCHPFIVLLLDPWVAFYLIVTFIRIRSEFPIRILPFGHSVWIEFNAVPVWIWIQLLCFFHQMKKNSWIPCAPDTHSIQCCARYK